MNHSKLDKNIIQDFEKHQITSSPAQTTINVTGLIGYDKMNIQKTLKSLKINNTHFSFMSHLIKNTFNIIYTL